MFFNKGGGGGGAGGGGGGLRDKCTFIFDACDQDQDGFLNVRELQLLVSLSSNGATSMDDATAVALMAHLGADPLRGLEKQHLEQAYERKATSSSIHDDFATIKATVDANAAFPTFAPGGAALQCPRNHMLRRGVATDGMWCDLCGAEQQRGAQLFGCHAQSRSGECDYDLCRRCVDAGTRRTGGARENWKAGFQGEWGDAFRKIKVTVNQLDDADEEVTVEWVG